MRIAWLTVHADLLYALDDGSQLSAQLFDLRDVLQAMDQGRRLS
jgi:hypothetical protein